jgi:hypothetical protein
LAKDFAFSWARWSVVSQGVLLDSQTGLQWTQEDNGQDIDWNSAQQYCQSSTWAGGGWRLPTVDELAGIYDASATPFHCLSFQGTEHSCKTSSLFHLTSVAFWSGSTAEPDKDGSALAWYVYLPDGYRLRLVVSASDVRALCVRRS